MPSVDAFELCVICNAPFVNLTRVMRKTCSSECARKNRRRKEKARAKRHRLLNLEKYRFRAELSYKRRRASQEKMQSCHVCGTVLPLWKHKYCSAACSSSARKEKAKTKAERTCRKCGTGIPRYRQLCEPCRLKPKPKRNWIRDAKTVEESIRRIAIQKAAKHKRNRLIRAANAIYCELQGKSRKPPLPPLPPLPPPTCVVCGMALTGRRKRILCGSRSCAVARQKEASRCHYLGKPLSATPRMIATANRKGDGKFRDKKRKKRQSPRGSVKERYQRKYAIYVAMREMNLLPQENGP